MENLPTSLGSSIGLSDEEDCGDSSTSLTVAVLFLFYVHSIGVNLNRHVVRTCAFVRSLSV